MSIRPSGTDGGNSLAERIAGLQGIVGCLLSTLLALIVTIAWLWINANLPAVGPFQSPSPTVTRVPISQSVSLPIPPVR